MQPLHRTTLVFICTQVSARIYTIYSLRTMVLLRNKLDWVASEMKEVWSIVEVGVCSLRRAVCCVVQLTSAVAHIGLG